jgi:nucleotide-binding universal stress UspA family protein
MKILLPTDGSEYSEGAARFLTALNLSPDDEINVFHVISGVPFRDDRDSYYSAVRKIKQEIAPRILDSAVEILRPLKARVSTALVDGYPGKSIIEVAMDTDADLVVMGARGLKGVKSFFLGSVTRWVAINSPKPALVVKPPQWQASGKLRVLFATDGSECAYAAGRFLATMPFHEDAEVTILNVVWPALSDIPERYAMEVDERMKEVVARSRAEEYADSERIIEETGKILRKRFSKIEGMTKSGDAVQETLESAEKLNADIIAVGSRGLRGLKGMLGSVSRNVLGHSRCSVLIGKAG